MSESVIVLNWVRLESSSVDSTCFCFLFSEVENLRGHVFI